MDTRGRQAPEAPNRSFCTAPTPSISLEPNTTCSHAPPARRPRAQLAGGTRLVRLGRRWRRGARARSRSCRGSCRSTTRRCGSAMPARDAAREGTLDRSASDRSLPDQSPSAREPELSPSWSPRARKSRSWALRDPYHNHQSPASARARAVDSGVRPVSRASSSTGARIARVTGRATVHQAGHGFSPRIRSGSIDTTSGVDDALSRNRCRADLRPSHFVVVIHASNSVCLGVVIIGLCSRTGESTKRISTGSQARG